MPLSDNLPDVPRIWSDHALPGAAPGPESCHFEPELDWDLFIAQLVHCFWSKFNGGLISIVLVPISIVHNLECRMTRRHFL
jgi:hypothetical protein